MNSFAFNSLKEVSDFVSTIKQIQNETYVFRSKINTNYTLKFYKNGWVRAQNDDISGSFMDRPSHYKLFKVPMFDKKEKFLEAGFALIRQQFFKKFGK